MKILHVIRGLANSSGTTHIVVPLSEEQARLGCEVTVLHVRKGAQPPVLPDPNLVASHCFPATLPLDNPGVSWGFARALSARIHTFDVAHTNGVTADWLDGERSPLAARLNLPPGSPTLLFLSRIHPKKGLDLLLRAFAAAATDLPGVVLVVAGSDAGSGYGEQMRALAGELGLGERCRFIGEVRGAEKRAVLTGADAYVLASHSEGLPVAVVEAMASALPVLITPGCNLPEVVTADAGLIVEPQVDAVAAGLRTLFADPARMRAWGMQGRALVRERFTWPQIARNTLAVYQDMIEPGRRTAATTAIPPLQ